MTSTRYFFFVAPRKPDLGKSLSDIHPEVAAQADGWDPSSVRAGSGLKMPWKCDIGHSWSATVANRSKGSGCPYCSNKAVLAGFNDLATTHPEIAREANGWDPRTVTFGNGKKVSWKCGNGHVWKMSPNGRTNRGRGCPVCVGQAVRPGFNDLWTTHPDLAKEANAWDPATKSFGSSREKMSWKCSQGHVWSATVAARSRGANCAVCNGKQIHVGINDLASTHPEVAGEADGWDPRTITKGSDRRVRWKCFLGHQWIAAVSSRTLGRGCPTCAGRKILVGFNDLATTHPEIAREANGWDPRTITFGHGKSLQWRCDQGHIWNVSPNQRSNYDTGCPSCAKFGFQPDRTGWLYLIENLELNMLQIGITNVPNDRLARHRGNGWELVEIRGPMDGYLTKELERAALKALKLRGAILGTAKNTLKFDGHTESWRVNSLYVRSIGMILEWIYEDEGIVVT